MHARFGTTWVCRGGGSVALDHLMVILLGCLRHHKVVIPLLLKLQILQLFHYFCPVCGAVFKLSIFRLELGSPLQPLDD